MARAESREAGQPTRAIRGYPRSLLRTPSSPLVARVRSRVDHARAIRVLEPPAGPRCDLSRVRPAAPRAMGQLIAVSGQVVDRDGRPVRAAVLEIWQANAAGKYIHHNDPSPVPIDPNFLGVGRIVTDDLGRYELHTIKPGAYAVPEEEEGSATGWWRPPHIHVSIFGDDFESRLVTQVYFPGEPLNERDLLLNSIPDPSARYRLIARFEPAVASSGDGALGYRHDFVLDGRRATPFEEGHQ